jgi:ParB/RepB/Spo0J family partition protein
MPDIELKKIQPNRLNPRLEFSKAGLDELADSIRQVGLVEPIIVRLKDDHYEIVVGERRYRAAQQAGLERVPCIVVGYSDHEVMELNVIENVQREDLSAIEKGLVCTELLEKFSDKYPSVTHLARRMGVSSGTLRTWLEAAAMPVDIQKFIAPETTERLVPAGKVDYWTATAVTRRVKEPKRAAKLIEEIATKRVPRRVALQVAKKVAREPEKPVSEIFAQTIRETPALLPFSRAHADLILRGRKTQTSRKSRDPKIRPGAVVQGAITHFADLKITDVQRKKLGDFSQDDARREGASTLEQFKDVWRNLHGEWDPDETVYVIRFELVETA